MTEVGVIGSKASAPEGGAQDVTVADVARWAELGIGQPMRSWLGGWVDEHAAELDATMSAELRAIIRGERSPEQASARVGAWIVGSIQERIARGIEPPNAESTIARKGSSTPLIDKGQLRSSITSRTPRE